MQRRFQKSGLAKAGVNAFGSPVVVVVGVGSAVTVWSRKKDCYSFRLAAPAVKSTTPNSRAWLPMPPVACPVHRAMQVTEEAPDQLARQWL